MPGEVEAAGPQGVPAPPQTVPSDLLRMPPTDVNAEFEELLANLPASGDVLSLRVAMLAEQGEELQAEAILRIAIQRGATSALRVTLGKVLIRQNRHKEAMTEMVSVLRADAENSGALMVLATCLVECGELDRGAKMLQKARVAGAVPSEVATLGSHLQELVGEDRTSPDVNHHFNITRPESAAEEQQRKRHETLMGRPNTDRLVDGPAFDYEPITTTAGPAGGPRRLPPPPLQSGSFAGLSTYDIEGADEDDLATSVVAPETLRLSDEGPLERVAASETSAEYAAPGDMTSAIHLADEDLASPDEATAHIPYDLVEQGLRQLEQAQAPSPSDFDNVESVQYDPNFASEALGQAHAPPADLDELPGFHSGDARFAEEPQPWADEIPGLDPAVLFKDDPLAERAAAQSRLDYGDWNDIPAAPQMPAAQQMPGAAPQPYQGQHFTPEPFQPSQPVHRSEPGFGGVPQPPVDPRGPGAPPRREETAVAAPARAPSNATGSLRILIEKRWPLVLIIFLAVVLSGFLGTTIVSGASLKSSLESTIQEADEARATDTYGGFATAQQKLTEATKSHSFMGSGFDRFVETTLPIPGLNGATLRRRSRAELAAVSAILEYRFEKVGERGSADLLKTAQADMPDHPMTAVAEAYVALAANRPAAAIQVLEAAHEKHAEDVRVTVALAWAYLALGRAPQAATATQELRAAPEQTVEQKFVLATIDAALGDGSASRSFAEVFAASPDHVDARIARSFALRGTPKALEDARKALDAVLTTLGDKTSSFQKARAADAFGSLYLATNEKEAAEERFRDALAKAPSRSEVYLPLLEFLSRVGKHEEVDAVLQKAKKNNAYSPAIAFFEANARLLESKPEATLKILSGLDFDDTRKAFLHGLALIDQYKATAAAGVLEAGQNAPGDPTEVQALYYVARSLANTEAVEDAVYQLDRIKSKNADNAVVHWASGVAETTGAQITKSKKTRSERLKAAAADLDRALKLRPDWAPIHFARCDVFLRELKTKQADESCLSGRQLAPNYAPGLVVTARLRLIAGKIDGATQLSEQALKLRPQEPVVGLLAARVAIERREFEEASKLLNKWLGKPFDKYEMSLLEGRLEFAKENYTRAAGYLKEAYQLRPNDGEASIYYAHTLAKLGESKMSGKILLEFLSHPSWSGRAWAVLGEVRRRQRRTKDALINLRKAEKLYRKQVVPKHYWSHLYTEYALSYRAKTRKWRHPIVKKMLDRGRKRGDPMDPDLNMTYGLYYAKKRRPNYDRAMRYFRKVVDVAPHRCTAVSLLRDLYASAKKDEKTVAALEVIYTANCAPADEKR